MASSLNESPVDTDALVLADKLISSGNGKELFESLVEGMKRRGAEQQAPVPAFMSRLERMMDIAPGVGAYLMARLYPLAGKTMHYEVYNGIELWMDSLASSEAAQAIARLADEAVRPTLGKRYHEWALRIVQNVSHRRK